VANFELGSIPYPSREVVRVDWFSVEFADLENLTIHAKNSSMSCRELKSV